jgi:hypothetical protein
MWSVAKSTHWAVRELEAAAGAAGSAPGRGQPGEQGADEEQDQGPITREDE